MIDLKTEKLVTLTQLAETFADPKSLSTIWRWHRRGVAGHRLETLVVGGKRYSTIAALERFAQKTTALADSASAGTAKSTLTNEQTVSP